MNYPDSTEQMAPEQLDEFFADLRAEVEAEVKGMHEEIGAKWQRLLELERDVRDGIRTATRVRPGVIRLDDRFTARDRARAAELVHRAADGDPVTEPPPVAHLPESEWSRKHPMKSRED